MFYNYERMSFQVLAAMHLCHSDGVFSVAARPYAALALRLRGTAVIRMGDRTVVSEVGDVTFLAAGVAYEAEYRGQEMLYIHLSECPYTETENIPLPHPSHIALLFQELAEKWQRGASPNTLKSLVFQLLSEIETDCAAGIPEALLVCSQYIRENYARYELRSEDICRVGNMSETSLYRHFITYYGLSPKQYTLRLRLNHAVQLLLRGEDSMEEIARQSGFQNAKYFARVFKEHYGLPPSHFRGGRG